MSALKLKQYLDDHNVKYVMIQHSPAFTSQEIAESSHVSGRDFAKTLILKVNDIMTMVALPADRKLLLTDLREMLETDHVKFATEAEFMTLFPDCEVGAMPPFGNLYDMPVYVAGCLADEREIAFNACSHTEVIKMAYDDFERLVQPRVVDFCTT